MKFFLQKSNRFCAAKSKHFLGVVLVCFFYGSICPESFDWSWDVMGLKMKSLVL